jgi:Rrf2 family protein
MISQTAEYALRAIVYLAERGEAQTIQQIAEKTQIPAGYLSKVMQNLARQEIVSSQRGLGGGFSLIADPKEISVYEIVQTVDPIRRILRCPLSLAHHKDNLCELHTRLNETIEFTERTFRETTVADLLLRPTFLLENEETKANPLPMVSGA